MPNPTRMPFALAVVSAAVALAAAVADDTKPLPPHEAVKALKTPGDLAVDLLLSEPLIQQPVFCNFDERGRMWVVQYRQYPSPAGLVDVGHDQFWRTRYDQPLPPPPYDTPDKAKFRGEDRITIHEDTDGDGSFDSHKVFLDGLNITTSVERGRGGVWVLTPPQLVFYPDANNDDVPDAPPVVHITGFHLEDTHSVANSLRWGPDGWLYFALGSTVTSDPIRPGIDDKPLFHTEGQHIIRYHPESRRLEVWAEGGGNAFGVEIDEQGRVFSGHNGGDTRGFHYPQNAYLQKGFEKHGPLANPYAFGYFGAMRHHQAARFTHNFIIYAGGSLPDQYHGKLIGVDPMNRDLPIAEITPRGATFQTKDVARMITTADTRFRPVDIKHGPDGNVYIADWYDFQVNHYRNHEGQITKQDGRIYRIRAADAKPGLAPFDLTKKTTAELTDLLRHDNRWMREQARRLLADRKDASIVPTLIERMRTAQGRDALELLWAIHLSGGFDDKTALLALGHSDPYVRTWSIRLTGDNGESSVEVAAKLIELAKTEPHVEVRSQLAATAGRLRGEGSPHGTGLAILAALAARDEDFDDPYLPLQVWWSLERHAGDRDAVVSLFADREFWKLRAVRARLGPQIMRRYAMVGEPADLAACEKLLLGAPEGDRGSLLRGFEQAYESKAMPPLPESLVAALKQVGGGSLALRVKLGDEQAATQALAVIADAKAKKSERRQLMAAFSRSAATAGAGALPAIIGCLADPDADIQDEALTALTAYDSPAVADAILAAWPKLDARRRDRAQAVLAARPAWSAKLLEAVDAGSIDKAAVSVATVDLIRTHRDADLTALADKHFGRSLPPQPAQIEQRIKDLTAMVNLELARGNARSGKDVFAQRCAACHTLHGFGGSIGPDLTPFDRHDVPAILLATLNPSAEIREGYASVTVTTKDGAIHVGFIAEDDADVLVIRGIGGQIVSIPKSQIAANQPLGRSLMPEALLDGLSDQQIKDLFAFLRTKTPL